MSGLMKVPQAEKRLKSEDICHREAHKGWKLKGFEVHTS